MGLFFCRSIIEALDERLWATPGHSRGAVFHVVLPIGENATIDQALSERPA